MGEPRPGQVNHALEDLEAVGLDTPSFEDAGRIIGVVTLESVRKVSRSDWDRYSITEVMTPITSDTTVDPHASMDTVLARFEQSPESIAVGYPGHVVGVITPWDLTTWLRRRGALAA